MTYACAGCGATVRDGLPLACPAARPGDDLDHVLTRVREGAEGTDASANPFLRYRGRLPSHALALAAGLGDDDFAGLVERLDAAVADVEGRGFRVTPLVESEPLARALGLARPVLVKDETGNVAGSHKGRHLMGVLLHLEVADRLGLATGPGPLAIASCGNAALAAAVLARAAGRPLQVFIPPTADPTVVARLESLGARIDVCERRAGEVGDPCYLRFLEAVAAGAVPFCCQGNACAVTIDGGRTLGYELADALAGRRADRVFVQVGGGALASSLVQAFAEVTAPPPPRFHPVQTEGAYPLRLAWEAATARLLGRVGVVVPADDAARAQAVADAPSEAIEEALTHAARHRAAYMRPWPQEPRSIASGILDDETYDWLAILRGLLLGGGYPVVVSEARLAEANRLALDATGIAVDPTGSAGLAGLLELAGRGALVPDEQVVVLFTGVRR